MQRVVNSFLQLKIKGKQRIKDDITCRLFPLHFRRPQGEGHLPLLEIYNVAME